MPEMGWIHSPPSLVNYGFYQSCCKASMCFKKILSTKQIKLPMLTIHSSQIYMVILAQVRADYFLKFYLKKQDQN